MTIKQPIITLTSDFGVQSQGVGIMESVIVEICPQARVIHLMHGLPDYDIRCAARTLETLKFVAVGYHVCVVDPGVGTGRKEIIVKAKRGDFLVGPDNGVLLPAAFMLGGVDAVVRIENPEYMRLPVSPIFHGRDVFAPAAAYLANGVAMHKFGSRLQLEDLVRAPYSEARIEGSQIRAEVIHVNKFGSLHLNILHEQWDGLGIPIGALVRVAFEDTKVDLPFVRTFGDVPDGTPLILKDDYGRVEVAINQGDFSKAYNIQPGTSVALSAMERPLL